MTCTLLGRLLCCVAVLSCRRRWHIVQIEANNGMEEGCPVSGTSTTTVRFDGSSPVVSLSPAPDLGAAVGPGYSPCLRTFKKTASKSFVGGIGLYFMRVVGGWKQIRLTC